MYNLKGLNDHSALAETLRSNFVSHKDQRFLIAMSVYQKLQFSQDESLKIL